MLTHSPARGDCIWGVCEVGQWVKGQFGEVNGRDMLWGLWGLSGGIWLQVFSHLWHPQMASIHHLQSHTPSNVQDIHVSVRRCCCLGCSLLHTPQLQHGLWGVTVYCNPLALGRDSAHIFIACPLSDIYAQSFMSATGYTSSEFTP